MQIPASIRAGDEIFIAPADWNGRDRRDVQAYTVTSEQESSDGQWIVKAERKDNPDVTCELWATGANEFRMVSLSHPAGTKAP